MPETRTATKAKGSQNFVALKEVRDGIVVLKDDSLRMIMMVSSLNFALKSENEQKAIIVQYQNFLNSLDFSVQFFIQSSKLNIKPYLEVLKQKEQEQTDELLKVQTREYTEFVEEFVSATNIVSKNFYIIISYTPPFLETKKNNPIVELFNKLLKKQNKTRDNQQNKFEEFKLQLQQRADTVVQGISRMGLRTAPLNTEEIIELFYNIYNPDEVERLEIPPYQNQNQAQKNDIV